MSSVALVRPARLEDLLQVLALEQATAEAPHWADASYRDYLAAASPTLLRKALLIAVVDTDSGESLQGFAAVTAVADEAELESIAVAAYARRSGVGRRLLQAVQAWAAQQGARRLLLEVRSSNTGAQAFYVAHGFAVVGLRQGYYRKPSDDAVLMRGDLFLQERTESSAGGMAEKASSGREL